MIHICRALCSKNMQIPWSCLLSINLLSLSLSIGSFGFGFEEGAPTLHWVWTMIHSRWIYDQRYSLRCELNYYSIQDSEPNSLKENFSFVCIFCMQSELHVQQQLPFWITRLKVAWTLNLHNFSTSQVVRQWPNQ